MQHSRKIDNSADYLHPMACATPSVHPMAFWRRLWGACQRKTIAHWGSWSFIVLCHCFWCLLSANASAGYFESLARKRNLDSTAMFPLGTNVVFIGSMAGCASRANIVGYSKLGHIDMLLPSGRPKLRSFSFVVAILRTLCSSSLCLLTSCPLVGARRPRMQPSPGS